MPMYIIGIAGGTGSGKTTVARKIIESLPKGEVALIPQDSYYIDATDMTMEERRKINYDHPCAFDWKLLIRQVKELKAGRAIEQPTPTNASSVSSNGISSNGEELYKW